MKRKTAIGIIKKIFISIIILILNFLGFINSVHAVNINSANLYTTGECGSLLTYKGIPVKVSYIQYSENGTTYPAYCLDKTKPGAEEGAYTVTVQEAINDVGLWKVIINGYPYKTIEELGVWSKEEAFTATKQAVYCYIHGNNPNDYGAIGEAGQRTLNALKQIVNNAQNSTENKITSTITINRQSEKWEQDKIDENYVSKTYNINAGAQIENYKIKLTKENAKNLGGIKLTDEKNKEKNEFSPNEKFKILIPIKNMTESGTIKIEATTKIKTKPVLFGKAPNSNYQDYAITTASFEDGTGIIKDTYDKNETKITIVKKDQEDGKRLKGVEFEILNEKEEVVYSGLKTNENGKVEIKNIIPGIYYIKEINTIDGYIKYDELIKIELELNQEITVTVNNRKQEKEQEIEHNIEKEIITEEVKKLPVTGM